VLGRLYTLVDVNVNAPDDLIKISPVHIYAPQIVGIQPITLAGIPFPAPPACTVWGPHHFWPGTQAQEVARRFIDLLVCGGIKAGLPTI
jgi:hypothetical protein